MKGENDNFLQWIIAPVLKRWNVDGISFCVDLDQSKNCILFLVRSWEYFLKRKLLSRLLDSIRSKGETSGGNRDMLSGATKSLISFLSQKYIKTYLKMFFCSGFTMHTLLNLFSWSILKVWVKFLHLVYLEFSHHFWKSLRLNYNQRSS